MYYKNNPGKDVCIYYVPIIIEKRLFFKHKKNGFIESPKKKFKA